MPASPQKLTVQPMSAGEMNKSAPPPVEASPAVVKPAPVAVAQAAPPPVATAPVAKTLAPATVDARAAATKAVVGKPIAPAPVKAEAAAPSAGGVRVQIGAFSSAALADKGWSDVAALLPGSMAGRSKHVEPVGKDGQTLYRTSVTGFADRASAAAFCDALKAKGKICFVKS
jgi:cell division protein FtsN